MPKRPTRPRDPNQLAKLILDIATGEISEIPAAPAAQKKARARKLGGLKGGKARAQSLSPRKRRQIAKKAATARWAQGAFGNDIDYAMLIKTYEGDSAKKAPAETRYSPAECTGSFTQRITGEPDGAYISTSIAERQNLTMRMSMRRFTRLTNGFSKKVDNHNAALALHFMHYNFARIHKTLRVTPAMEASVADHVWSLEEIARLAD